MIKYCRLHQSGICGCSSMARRVKQTARCAVCSQQTKCAASGEQAMLTTGGPSGAAKRKNFAKEIANIKI